MQFFASSSKLFSDLAKNEAVSCGIQNARSAKAGIEFEATVAQAQEFCLQTRVCNRVFLKLGSAEDIKTEESFREAAQRIDWTKYVSPDKAFFITSTVFRSPWLNNTKHAVFVLKDEVCDAVRAKFGERPSVVKDTPDVVFHFHIEGTLAVFYVDFSGRAMSKRGYRTKLTEAYLSEHSAAALIYRTDWYKSGMTTPLIDPFCGSGTILIEAALMASDTAPGIISPDRFAFLTLPEFNESEWQNSLKEAQEKSEQGKERLRTLQASIRAKLFRGIDIDPKAVEASSQNAIEAHVEEFTEFRVADSLTLTQSDFGSSVGQIVTDMPYGVRLKVENLPRLYAGFGEVVSREAEGWNVTILSSQGENLENIDMKPERTNTFTNGEIEAQAAHYRVFTKEERLEAERKKEIEREKRRNTPLPESVIGLFNEIEKRKSELAGYLGEHSVTCWHVIDAAISGQGFSVDIYENRWAVVNAYKNIENEKDAISLAIERSLNIEKENVYFKERVRQKGANQYVKSGNASKFMIVKEGNYKLYCNFEQFIDTGLFLDHRPTRERIAKISKGKSFLNLFCYTGSATVAASVGGCLSSVNVDASNTYLDWAKSNLRLNRQDGMKHHFYSSDAIRFLKELPFGTKFDLIFCDPPTFSNSKDRRTFTMEKDHAFLIRLCMKHLEENGLLIFSTNFSTFKMDEEILHQYNVVETTKDSTAPDYLSDNPTRFCFDIRHKKVESARLVGKRLFGDKH